MAAFKPPAAPRGLFGNPPTTILRGAPVGTFAPGTKVQVGNHRVVIEKYLSEGGFAHVYVVRLPKPVDGVESAVLKRVAVPDKEHLANMRTEVETMKKLKGHRHIVRYIDSHASQLKGGGYEVFLLMEYCSGGGLIDFMNTRLRDRLREPEILKIFADVAEGVACMHYLRPPLLHRDLKVENVLISGSGSSRTYKLCDFGSTAPPRSAASSAAEGRLIEDDVQRHTTLQYRSPEMIDVYRKQPIDEKSDVWALGVFLYKLCYYTTPFEDVGQMAILNASFKYPAFPPFSDKLKMLIAMMLKENPAKRPNIYQVLQQTCSMQDKPVPVTDIYTGRSQSENRKNQQVPRSSEAKSASTGAVLSPPAEKKSTTVPDIAPMRRGRPTRPVSHHGSTQPSPSPLRMMDQKDDPFASLDGGKTKAGDELSLRFPTLDQFSLLTDKGKFDFESSSKNGPERERPDLSQRVLNALADEAFAQPLPADQRLSSKTAPPVANPSHVVLDSGKPFEAKGPMSMQGEGPRSTGQGHMMISTEPLKSPSPLLALNEKSVHRSPPVDHEKRATSPLGSSESRRIPSGVGKSGSRLSNLLSHDAARSQPAMPTQPRPPSSSRPSLEGARSPVTDSVNNVSRSKSTNAKARPASASMAFKFEPRGGKSSRKTSMEEVGQLAGDTLPPLRAVESDTTITSDVEFLRAKEGEVKPWKSGKRHSSGSGHQKRGSLSSISLSGTKNILSGKFGDAFKKFETAGTGLHHRSPSPSPSGAPINILAPMSGSEPTELSDEPTDLSEAHDLSPEARREVERRRLSAEERRVADAAAEYRKRMAQKNGERTRDPARAISIQNKVQSLLKENNKPAPEISADDGHFTDSSTSWQMKQFEAPQSLSARQPPRVSSLATASAPLPPPMEEPRQETQNNITFPSNLVANDQSSPRVFKPMAPPKPFKMRTGTGEAVLTPSGAAATTTTTSGVDGKVPLTPSDDWESNFSKRYPSLSGLEMVETEISGPKVATVRTKEV